MDFAAFFSYIAVSSLTPGPNNIMSMTNAGKYGFKKALPFNLGVFFGVFILVSCCAAFSSLLYSFMPSIEPVMRCVGAAYILYLAWKVWRDKPASGRGALAQTNTFSAAIALQFVNVKAMLYGLTTMSSFVLPYYRGFWQLAGFSAVMAAQSLIGVSCWALFGSVFERLFKRHGKVINAVMALLLVYCAASMLRGVLF
ncbi:MAG: LysE family transporter [Oscillospiraceae bacterium]|nr:LysE family transporter [Oscillospiraceae bacterium]